MAKWAHDDVLDSILDHIADNGSRLCVCSAQPTTYTEAITTYMLAIHNLTTGDGNGDWTIANGDVNGRKLTLAEQAAFSITNTGTATHVAIADSGNSALLIVTTCTSQALVSGNTVTAPALDWAEISDPS